ncbi:predicted protein [Phaeodactylum tricornutum CCAP 1055/1]|jgi:uncharacterized protein YbjT (DUF2867 family)|uniref:NAD(P)-binding domain-containing protein n=2 Tax=Phaeodactylum tricornutum TaxID=2850 RepID=B7GC19_PHATC|nr:predicted protein [Phaeodactylum tricornutum CCAP 1055/1]EEC43787.1 predicted protein [Phaeodactylum tricornutum CCAP 1055/1]|eukprot:XP_002184728.1 predicted protein [Phaeodactylum tricornutum CCAP 1055/1]
MTETRKAFVVGGTGGVGSILIDELIQRGYTVSATYRKEQDKEKLESQGATAVHMDFVQMDEDAIQKALEGFQTVFFAAGSGGKDVYKIDRDGAIKFANAIRRMENAHPHYIVLSALGCDQPDKMPENLKEYSKAKKEADDVIAAMEDKGVQSTIVRPGNLTNDSAKENIIFRGVVYGQSIEAKSIVDSFDANELVNTRSDVAKVMAESADIFTDNNNRKTRVFEMIQGNESDHGSPIHEGLSSMKLDYNIAPQKS